MFRYKQVFNKIPWRVVGRVVGGVALATPVVAIAQGSFLLYDYRRNHGDAPLPDMPSRGLVIAGYSTSTRRMEPSGNNPSQKDEDSSTSPSPASFENAASSVSAPLRLLVIGDSLAAGVGTSESSTPVLPHSIAVHLSSALHGRAVVWTCVGVPGQSSASLVHVIDDLATTTSDLLLERWWSEWHVQRERIATATRETQAWWKERRNEEGVVAKDEDESSKISKEEASNRIVRWWKRSTRQVKNDVESLKRIIRTAWVDGGAKKDAPLVRRDTHRTLLRRRTTKIEPDLMMGSYDIAIVLTGLNDLKESYLPFMVMKTGDEEKHDNSGNLRDHLVRVTKALESKMRTILPNNSLVTDQEEQQTNGPLVVFPALPYEPTILNRLRPLSWFLIPLLKTVDEKKKELAKIFPDRVLYVEVPDRDFFDLAENDENETKIPILLQLNDIRVDVQERIEKLMRQYYGKGTVKEEEDNEFHNDDHDSCCHESTRPAVISADGIHPSDRGYEAWGEHIARKIVEEWEHQKATRRR